MEKDRSWSPVRNDHSVLYRYLEHYYIAKGNIGIHGTLQDPASTAVPRVNIKWISDFPLPSDSGIRRRNNPFSNLDKVNLQSSRKLLHGSIALKANTGHPPTRIPEVLSNKLNKIRMIWPYLYPELKSKLYWLCWCKGRIDQSSNAVGTQGPSMVHTAQESR